MDKVAKAEPFNVSVLSAESVKERLFKLSKLNDRDDPPFFIGRGDITSDVQYHMREAASLPKPKRGETLVIQGIPGVGKTTLKAWLAASLSGREVQGADGVKRTVLAASVMPNALSKHPNALCRSITKSMRQELAHCERAQSALRRRVNDAGAMAILMKTGMGEFDVGESVQGVTSESTHDVCFGVYAANGLWPQRTAILLLLDEAQNLDDTTETRACLNFLHEQSNSDVRILPVFFGLPNTRQRLAELGLSRLEGDAVTNVGLLEKGEGEAMIGATFDLAGLTWDNSEWRGILQRGKFTQDDWEKCRDGLVQQVAKDACEFPQHLIRGLKAVGSALGERVPGLKLCDWSVVMGNVNSRHKTGREQYYEDRLENVSEHLAALGAMAHLLGTDGELSADDAADVLSLGRKTPYDEDEGIRQVDLLAAKGLLTPCGNNELSGSPIPSMVKHLQDKFIHMARKKKSVAHKMAQELGIKLPSSTVTHGM